MNNNVISANDKNLLTSIEKLGKEMETLTNDDQTLAYMNKFKEMVNELENKEIAIAVIDFIIEKMWGVDYPLGSKEWDICFEIKHGLSKLRYDIVSTMS